MFMKIIIIRNIFTYFSCFIPCQEGSVRVDVNLNISQRQGGLNSYSAWGTVFFGIKRGRVSYNDLCIALFAREQGI
jgi:hypothetical protein